MVVLIKTNLVKLSSRWLLIVSSVIATNVSNHGIIATAIVKCVKLILYCRQVFYDEMGTYEDGLAVAVPSGFYLIVLFGQTFHYYIMDEVKLDETALTLLKVNEEKIPLLNKELSNRLEGYFTCTTVLLGKNIFKCRFGPSIVSRG